MKQDCCYCIDNLSFLGDDTWYLIGVCEIKLSNKSWILILPSISIVIHMWSNLWKFLSVRRRVMCFHGSSVFVGSFSHAFSRARRKISQLTHVYKHLWRVACCLIKMLSIKFTSIFAVSFSRGNVGKQVSTISCCFFNSLLQWNEHSKNLDLAVFQCLCLGHCDHVIHKSVCPALFWFAGGADGGFGYKNFTMSHGPTMKKSA